MVRRVLSQLKHSELYILSCGKDLGLRPRPFPQLRMYNNSGFILYVTIGALLIVVFHCKSLMNMFGLTKYGA